MKNVKGRGPGLFSSSSREGSLRSGGRQGIGTDAEGKKQKAEVFWACLAALPGKRQAGFQKMEKREEVKGGSSVGPRQRLAADRARDSKQDIKVKATETL